MSSLDTKEELQTPKETQETFKKNMPRNDAPKHKKESTTI